MTSAPPGPNLVLLRHGSSVANDADRFAGWLDEPLSARGREEARAAGESLVAAGVLPTVVHTSLLSRAVVTANLALDAADRAWIPVRRSWRLNERHYGALQGRSRGEVRARYGDDVVRAWRRSYEGRPPASAREGAERDDRYRGIPADRFPRAESIADVSARLLPYWSGPVSVDLAAGHVVLVVSHGNALRALLGAIEGVVPPATTGTELVTGRPMLYSSRGGAAPRTTLPWRG